MNVISKIAIVLMALVVASCSHYKDVNRTISQLMLCGNSTPLTRYSGSGGFDEGDAVGVYVVKQGVNADNNLSNSGNHADNKKFINENVPSLGMVLRPNPGDEVYWSDSHLFDIYSYYPYIESISSVNSVPFSVGTTQSVAENYFGSDFLWGKVLDIIPTSSPVQVDYKHLLSEINIHILPGEGYTLPDLKNILTGIDLKNAITDATINLSSGVVSAGTQQNTITTYKKISNEIVFGAIIVPQSITTSNPFVEIKVGDKAYPLSFDMEAVSGKSYKIRITVDKGFNSSEVTLNGITSWDFVEGPSLEVPIINPIHKNIKNYCSVGFESSGSADVCLDGATIGDFICDPGRGSDYFDYAHNPDKRANITNDMDVEVRFKTLTSSNSNRYSTAMYVDWNNDGDFVDQGEFVGFKEVIPGGINSVQKLNYTISIPNDAVSPTTMRIMPVNIAKDPSYNGCDIASGTVYDIPVYF